MLYQRIQKDNAHRTEADTFGSAVKSLPKAFEHKFADNIENNGKYNGNYDRRGLGDKSTRFAVFIISWCNGRGLTPAVAEEKAKQKTDGLKISEYI